MGVRGLYRYIDKLYKQHNIEHKVVNILDEIESYRKNSTSDPVIFIDLWTMAHNLKMATRDVPVGFRLNVVKQQFANFLHKLKAAGAVLIFVFEKSQVNNKDLSESQNEHYLNGCKVAAAKGNLNYLATSFETMINTDRSFEFPLNLAVMLALSQVAPKYGEMLGMLSIKHEPSDHNVYMAGKMKAMAILSLNTNYLFHDGKWEFWSDANLDMDAMTVRQYNRQEVLEKLEIPREKAVLLIALSEAFRSYKSEKSKNVYISVEKLVTFVRHQQYPTSYKTLSKNIHSTFKHCPKNLEANLEKTERRFDESQSFGPCGYASIMELIKDDFANYAEEILMNSPIYISPVYFDLSKSGPTLKTVVMPYMRKTTGILLKNTKDRKPRHIMVKTSSDSSIAEQKVEPIFPDFAVEQLHELVQGNFPENDKWKLLLWISSLQLTVAELQSVPRKFLVDVIVCLHLVKSKVMKLKEAMCLLLSIVEAHETEPSTEYPQEINERAFHLALWYQKVFVIFHSCIAAVGLKCFQGEIMFDGALFQRLYADKNAQNTSSRSSTTDLYLLNKLVPVISKKVVKTFTSQKENKDETSTPPPPSFEEDRLCQKSSKAKLETNFEGVSSKNPKSANRKRLGDLKI